jgi:hypothetical protein
MMLRNSDLLGMDFPIWPPAPVEPDRGPASSAIGSHTSLARYPDYIHMNRCPDKRGGSVENDGLPPNDDLFMVPNKLTFV